MDRVSSTGYVTVDGVRYFQNKNLAGGIQGTTFDEVFFNSVQESIVGAEVAFGLTPANSSTDGSPAPDPQLAQAVARAAGANVTTVTANITLTADNAGLVLVSAAAGSVAITLPASASANGKPLRFSFVRTDSTTNAVTLSLAGTDTMLVSGLTQIGLGPQWRQALISDGAGHWVPVGGLVNRFDAASPPAADVLLLPGDKQTITFESAASLPLKVASQPGVYKLTIVATADNTTGEDLYFEPNNTTYTNAFSFWSVQNTDSNLQALGTASAQPSYIPSTLSPYVGAVPFCEAAYNAIPYFNLDMFNGPGASDSINGIGPWMSDITISTFTSAKMVKAHSGVAGGGGIVFAKWSDTTTVWTSLGTIKNLNSTSFSGVATVERIA